MQKLALSLILPLLATAPAFAQSPQSTPAQPFQARPAQQALLNSAQFVDAAITVVRSIENNQAASVWDTASDVMKRAATRDGFVAVTRTRQLARGPITPRDWIAISRTRVTPQTANVPQGDYLTVALLGTDRAGATVRQTVSFHLDADNQWRLAGYDVPAA